MRAPERKGGTSQGMSMGERDAIINRWNSRIDNVDEQSYNAER
jgi:hypothetical protein